MIKIALNSHRVANKSQLMQVPSNSFSSDCSEFFSRKSHVVASIFERDNGKNFTALNKEERLLKRGNLRLKFEVFMEKIFTALNKELAKFFSLSFDYLLTFRTLKVQCFQGVSASHQEGGRHICTPSPSPRILRPVSRNFEAKNYTTLNKE